METALEIGLDWIRAIQTFRTPALDALFSAFTFLGDEEFYLLLAPVIIWCVDYGLGVRLGVLFLLSGTVNVVLKDVLMQPRPCDLQPEVCIDEASGYGLPSGHAQNAIVFWGILANWLSSSWAWTGAVALMLLIGFSRVYLGVHFPTDVLGGWMIGILFLALYFRSGSRAERWVVSLGTARQILLVAALALVVVTFDSSRDTTSAAAGFAGFGIGLALMQRGLPFSAGGPIWQRAARYLVGVAIIAALFIGLRAVFPQEGEAYHVPLRILRYLLIGLWTSFGAPKLFQILRLAAPEGVRTTD